MEQPLLYVATPVHTDSVTVGYCTSLLKTCLTFRCRVDMCRGSFLPRNRDILTARFLESEATHMLCVDSDIRWEPEDAQKLLDVGVGFVSGCYAQKDGTGAVTVRPSWAGGEPEKLQGNSPLLPVDGTGAGFMLLEREHVKRLAAYWDGLRYTTQNGERVWGLWAPLITDGRLDGEDYAFCRRWARVHGKPLLHTGVVLHHSGAVDYSPNMEAFLREIT